MPDLTPVGVVFHSVHIFYNTPDLLTGLEIWEPRTPGEVILRIGWISIIQGWDGTTPHLRLWAFGDAATTTEIIDVAVGTEDVAVTANTSTFPNAPYPSTLLKSTTGVPYMINVDTGGGSPFVSPGSTQGEAFVVIAVGASYLAGVSRSSASPIQS